uniref:IlGF domain-containing protein n=1 Tax=Steinernema glaseri TaxID=37863 RepID=A0A1I7ZTN4_9BILA
MLPRFVAKLFFPLLALSSVHAIQLCGPHLTELLADICTYAGESKPCFRNAQSSRLGPLYAIMSAMRACCEKECSVADVVAQCCFEKQCLEKCYPHRLLEGAPAIIVLPA